MKRVLWFLIAMLFIFAGKSFAQVPVEIQNSNSFFMFLQ